MPFGGLGGENPSGSFGGDGVLNRDGFFKKSIAIHSSTVVLITFQSTAFGKNVDGKCLELWFCDGFFKKTHRNSHLGVPRETVTKPNRFGNLECDEFFKKPVATLAANYFWPVTISIAKPNWPNILV